MLRTFQRRLSLELNDKTQNHGFLLQTHTNPTLPTTRIFLFGITWLALTTEMLTDCQMK